VRLLPLAILALLTAFLSSCTDSKKEATPATISFYGDYALNFLTLGLKPLSELPPNASILNYGGFVSDGSTKSPIKFNLMLVGQFELAQTSSATDMSGISGKITSLSHSVNDQTLLTVSNLNMDAKAFIAHINAKDLSGAWSDIVSSTPALLTSKETPLMINVSCSAAPTNSTPTKSLALNQMGMDVKPFIAQCLAPQS